MREIYFDELRHMVNEYIHELDAESPPNSSTKWFLLKYLKRIAKAALSPTRPGQVEGAVKAMVRFYVDNIDEKTRSGDMCLNIYEKYRKTLRDSQAQSSKPR